MVLLVADVVGSNAQLELLSSYLSVGCWISRDFLCLMLNDVISGVPSLGMKFGTWQTWDMIPATSSSGMTLLDVVRGRSTVSAACSGHSFPSDLLQCGSRHHFFELLSLLSLNEICFRCLGSG